MTFSVDDLVSSLSSSHIGQEAMDLAALQAQLSATLFSHAPSSSTRAHEQQACNTPLASSFSKSMGMAIDTAMTMRSSKSRRESISTHPHPHRRESSASVAVDDAMEEDERMVEELLIPSSPMMMSATSMASHQHQHQHPYGPAPSPISPSYSMASSFPIPTHPHPQSQYPHHPHPQTQQYHDSPSNAFTTTDPFYLAQLQAAQQPAPSAPSAFAQNGRMAQGSRFALQAAF